MNRITPVSTHSGMSVWKKHLMDQLQVQRIQSLFTIAVINPFEMDSTSRHFYGFLFLDSVHDFHDPMVFKNEIQRFFVAITEYKHENLADVAFLLELIQSYFPRQNFPDLLTEEQLLKSTQILKEFIEVDLSVKYDERFDPKKISDLKRILASALKEYNDFIVHTDQENEKKSYGLTSLLPFHSHGPEGLARVKKLSEMIADAKNINIVNDAIKVFFDKRTTACRSHSFISFFLDELAKDQEFLQQTTMKEFFKGNKKGADFKNKEMHQQRVVALEILNCRGLFFNSHVSK